MKSLNDLNGWFRILLNNLNQNYKPDTNIGIYEPQNMKKAYNLLFSIQNNDNQNKLNLNTLEKDLGISFRSEISGKFVNKGNESLLPIATSADGLRFFDL